MANRSILIVDDEPEIIELIEFFLKDEGYKVFAANNGVAARDILASEEIGLIISDIRMPKENGIQLLQHIKRNNATIPFIFMSAFTNMTDKDAVNLGAQGFILKPWDEDDLIQTVTKIWNQAHPG